MGSRFCLDIRVMADEPLTLGLTRALAAIGDRRSILTIWAAIESAEPTFGALRHRLDFPDAILAERLRQLTTTGLLERTPIRPGASRSHYHPTHPATLLWMVRLSAWRWDRTWAPQSTAHEQVIHTECVKSVVPAFGCASCGAIGVTPYDVTTEVSDRLQHELNLPVSRRRTRLASVHDPDAATLLGDSWSMGVLGSALLGAQSFSDFKTTLGGISTATLSEKLHQFVEVGMLQRTAGDQSRRRPYRVTPKTTTFFPVFAALTDWSRTFADEPGMVFRHQQCESELRPQYTCNSCNQVLTHETTRFSAA